jgi:hypothetical protein
MIRIKDFTIRLVLTFILLLVMALITAQILTGPDINDEHMYLAAAKLLDQHTLYRDFAFLQTPYMVYLYKGAMDLFPDGGMLLTARWVKLGLVALTLILFARLCLLFSGSLVWTGALVWLLPASSVFRSDLHFARNYQLPLLLTLLALGLWAAWLTAEPKGIWRLGSAGFLLGLAVGCKLTFGVFIPAAILTLVVLSPDIRRRLILSAVFLTGVLLGMLPMLVIFWRAGWDCVRFGLFDYHALNIRWRGATAFDQGMDGAGKARLGLGQLLEISNLSVLLLIGLAVVLVLRRQKRSAGQGPALLSLLGIWCGAALLLFVLPKPVWIWYLTPLWVLLFLLAAALYRLISDAGARRPLLLVASLLVGVTLVVNLSQELDQVRAWAFDRSSWTGIRMKRESEALRRHLEDAGIRGAVASLRPLHALEAGLPIFAELASADFAYRVGDYVSDEARQKLRITSPSRIAALLNHDPPAALILGFDDDLEKPLLNFARKRGYTRVRNLIRKAEVYIRPPAAKPSN